VPFVWSRVAGSIAVAAIALLAASACGGHEQGPNANPQGLFPQHFSEKGFVEHGSTLIRATAASSDTRTYGFDVDAPFPIVLVASCSGAHITVSGAGGRCRNGLTGVVGMCVARHEHFVAHVSARQPHVWGIAVYRAPDPEGCGPRH
jgi:hypothetical protein